MARGWESKAVEAQIEEGKRSQEELVNPRTSPAERRREQRLESLRLSRSRLLEQLERASHSSHRKMLQNGLRAIETEIEELSQVKA